MRNATHNEPAAAVDVIVGVGQGGVSAGGCGDGTGTGWTKPIGEGWRLSSSWFTERALCTFWWMKTNNWLRPRVNHAWGEVRCRQAGKRAGEQLGKRIREIGCDGGKLKMQVCMAEWRINMHRRQAENKSEVAYRSFGQQIVKWPKFRTHVGGSRACSGAFGGLLRAFRRGSKCAKERYETQRSRRTSQQLKTYN